MSGEETGSDAAFTPPEGFYMDAGRGPFTSHNGPIYRRDDGETFEVGLHILERHCNGYGFLHGGMVSAFADGALAWCVGKATRRNAVTIRLSLDFLETARIGDWLVARPTHISTQGDIVHVEADIIRNNQQLSAHASGVFHIVRRKPK